jgi:hypothetical protein
MKYSNQVDVRVLVGSANYGHSTHMLFSHFVEKILPKNAYDTQLLQRMKSDATTMQLDGTARRAAALPQGQPAPMPAHHTPPLPAKLHGRS